MDNFDYPAIGQRIKQLRKRKGLNQTELAQMLKKSLRTVQKYETGEIEVSIAVVNQLPTCWIQRRPISSATNPVQRRSERFPT